MTARVAIEVAEPVSTGEPFRVAVTIETTTARITRGVTLLLRGFTSLRTPAGPMDLDRRTFGAWRARLAENERLEPGAHRFEGHLSLLDDAPPSARGVIDIDYQLDARVELEFPWMFDATATRTLAVARPARRRRPPRRPVTVSSAAGGAGAFFVELSLDDTSFAPGESINGSFSLGNIGDRGVDTAFVSLVPRLQGFLGGGDLSVLVPLVGVGEGRAVHFSLPLPPTAALSFASRTLEIEQAIRLRVDGYPAECRIPVVIDTFPLGGGGPYR